jgi:hypothetical protein
LAQNLPDAQAEAARTLAALNAHRKR